MSNLVNEIVERCDMDMHGLEGPVGGPSRPNEQTLSSVPKLPRVACNQRANRSHPIDRGVAMRLRDGDDTEGPRGR